MVDEIPSVEHRIDWITLTKRGFWPGVPNAARAASMPEALSVAIQSLHEMGVSSPRLIEQLPGRGYHYGFKEFGTGLLVSVAANLENQGVMLRASGTVLDEFPETRTAARLALDSMWRCSRLDVAFDLYNTTITPENMFDRWREAHPGSKRRVVQLIDNPGGSTFYIGSRESELLLRAYEKGKKEGTAIDWLRIELELKGAFIHNAASALLENPIAAAGVALRLLDAPRSAAYFLLDEYADGQSVSSRSAARPKSNREVWFLSQVLKAFTTLSEDDPAAARRVLAAFEEVVNKGHDIKFLN